MATQSIHNQQQQQQSQAESSSSSPSTPNTLGNKSQHYFTAGKNAPHYYTKNSDGGAVTPFDTPSTLHGLPASASQHQYMQSSQQKLQGDWYLKVAVGGRRNFLFQPDNLTPAPYHVEQQPAPPVFEDLSNESADFIEGVTDVQQSQPQQQRNLGRPAQLNVSETELESTSGFNTPHNQSQHHHRQLSTDSFDDQLPPSPTSGTATTPGQIDDDQVSPLSSPARQSKTPPLTPIMRSTRSTASNFSSGGGEALTPQESKQSEERKESGSTSSSAASSRRSSLSMQPHQQYNMQMTPRTRKRLQDVVSNSGLSLYLHSGFGQDSFFVACDTVKDTGRTSMVLGIADGVGGWRSSGVDSGIMSRAIMRTSLQYVKEAIAKSGELSAKPASPDRMDDGEQSKEASQYSNLLADPRELMAKAYYAVKAENSVPAGSTTACIVTLLPVSASQNAQQQQQQQSGVTSGSQVSQTFPMFSDVTAGSTTTSATQSSPNQNQGQLTGERKLGLGNQASTPSDYVVMRAANLGDSGYIVVRFVRMSGGEAAATKHSEFPFKPQVVGFTAFQRDESNVVKQLAVIPESIAQSNEYYEYCDDKPEEATTSEHKLLDGDIVILASDGLWDNFDISDESYVNLPYGYGNHGSGNMMRMRVQQHINDQDRIRRQHQIIERIVMESLTNTPSSFVTARDSPRQDALNKRRNSTSGGVNEVPEIDPAALCARLMQHVLEFQRKPDGKPDDLVIMVTQLKHKAANGMGNFSI